MPKIKKYPHFDADLTSAKADSLANDPQAVSKHAFYPFIEYSEGYTKFAVKGKSGERKSRPIKYASRRDSYIYSKYRSILVSALEKELRNQNLDRSVLAYRRIPKDNARGCKSNIDFAYDAFTKIKEFGNCFVYALDISQFFENLDHSRLKKCWMQLMSFDQLPPDHYAVFRNVTRYAYVNREKLYRTLGYTGPGAEDYKVKRVPLQVCDYTTFRDKVVPLIEINERNCGIPQGSPISDVLANIYMLEFDKVMVAEMSSVNGLYFRYPDDILLIVPGGNDDHAARLQFVYELIKKTTVSLEIKPAKSTVHKFSLDPSYSDNQQCYLLQGITGKNGLEYLGFRFNGRRIYIKDKTRARLQRKMTYATRSAVKRLCDASPDAGRSELKQHFNPALVLRQFYKIRDYEPKLSRLKWTFWTYIMRSQEVLGDDGKSIARQLRNFKRSIKYKAEAIIDQHTTRP